MLFNSYIFILLFLPVTLIVYYVLNRYRRETAAKVWLIAMSFWFYAYYNVRYLAVIIASILFNYLIVWAMERTSDSRRICKSLLGLGIVANLVVIFYFKYYNFFLENTNWLLGTSFQLKNIIMPLGISFFTFQQISYLVDSYRGETKEYSLIDYALFVTFFPQLVAGPIVTHSEMIPQFRDASRKKPDQDYLAKGIFFFAVGMFKKVLIADTLGVGADWGFSQPAQLSAMDTVVVSLLYTFQLYFDFSGYCDMASGIASMFHIDLPINFNSPYKATSIIDFWKRWHMSLTGFLRKYVYFPLGGSRKGKARTICNIMIVFLLSGIWHGANWTFILWGCMHGLAQVLNRIGSRIWDKLPKILRWLLTFMFIDLVTMLFRANTVSDYVVLLQNIFTGRAGGLSQGLIKCFDVIEFTYLEDHIAVLGRMVEQIYGLNMWMVLLTAAGIAFCGKNLYEKKFVPSVWNGLGSIVLLVWTIMSLSGISIFLYFNF